MRQATVARKTNETDIQLTLTLEGETSRIDTGCGFLDHMLELFARHGGFGLELSCKGDTRVDYHHTVEDIGIVLGEAFRQALGDKRGINRYGSFLLPMDEALVLVAVDLSGRTTCCCELHAAGAEGRGFRHRARARSSFSGSAAAGSSPSTCGSWRARTPTTSSRRRSRDSAGRWRSRWRWTAATPTRCPAPRVCSEPHLRGGNTDDCDY